jgi:hypothetical protein
MTIVGADRSQRSPELIEANDPLDQVKAINSSCQLAT